MVEFIKIRTVRGKTRIIYPNGDVLFGNYNTGCGKYYNKNTGKWRNQNDS